MGEDGAEPAIIDGGGQSRTLSWGFEEGITQNKTAPRCAGGRGVSSRKTKHHRREESAWMRESRKRTSRETNCAGCQNTHARCACPKGDVARKKRRRDNTGVGGGGLVQYHSREASNKLKKNIITSEESIGTRSSSRWQGGISTSVRGGGCSKKRKKPFLLKKLKTKRDEKRS